MHRNLILLAFLLAAPAARAGVVVNEVSFDAPAGSPDWVELFNAGPEAVSVDGWTLSDMDVAAGNEAVILLSTPVPAGAFLVVHVDASGEGETDFSDGRAAVYTGTSTTVSLAATEDEVLLSSAAPVDFLAWVTDGHYDGTSDQAAAVAAGLWTSGEAVAATDTGGGYSIGRSTDGADLDVPADFVPFPAPTPGASNAATPPPPPPPPPPPSTASPRDVVINEVAWGGTAASAAHEWLELFNNSTRTISMEGWTLRSGDGDMEIGLAGVIAAGGYFLLERTSDAPVSDLAAGRVYVGSLSNGGEDLLLLDASSGTVDAARFAGGGWPAGSASPDYRTMERVTPSADGDLGINWRSNDASVRNGMDAGGGSLNGTPGARNAAFSLLLPLTREQCDNGLDDDGDGLVDGWDPDCGSSAPPAGRRLSVDAASNPFSPMDPDPARRAARILFNGGSPEAPKVIRVTDVRGEVVRSWSSALLGLSSGSVSWDGTDDQGRLLPPGVYVVHFESSDASSGASAKARDTVILGYPFK